MADMKNRMLSVALVIALVLSLFVAPVQAKEKKANGYWTAIKKGTYTCEWSYKKDKVTLTRKTLVIKKINNKNQVPCTLKKMLRYFHNTVKVRGTYTLNSTLGGRFSPALTSSKIVGRKTSQSIQFHLTGRREIKGLR